MNPREYLELWLSEQIPIKDWLKILDNNPAVEELYSIHVVNKDRGKNVI
jgi:hypothetical protein